MTDSSIPLFAILCPATAAILILLSSKRPNIRESWTIIAGISQFALIASLIPTILDGAVIRCTFFPTMFEGVAFGFKVDAFVNTACPRVAEDFVHFEKPVLSAKEFEVVLGERSWEDIAEW